MTQQFIFPVFSRAYGYKTPSVVLLYELSIIEKEKILIDNQKKQEKIYELIEELNLYKIENYSKKSYYQKNKEKIIEKVKEYNKNYVKTPEQIKEYNKRAYEKRKAKKMEEPTL